MKVESILVTLGLICVAGSIASMAYVQRLSLKLDKEKWELLQLETRKKASQENVLAYARELTGAIKRAEALALMGKNDPFSIGPQVMTDYDKATLAASSAITQHRLIIAAQDANTSRRLDKVAAAYGALDECVAGGLARIRARDVAGFQLLAQCKRQAELATAALQREFSAALTTEGSENAAPAQTPTGR